jgi:hypothetical protein
MPKPGWDSSLSWDTSLARLRGDPVPTIGETAAIGGGIVRDTTIATSLGPAGSKYVSGAIRIG